MTLPLFCALWDIFSLCQLTPRELLYASPHSCGASSGVASLTHVGEGARLSAQSSAPSSAQSGADDGGGDVRCMDDGRDGVRVCADIRCSIGRRVDVGSRESGAGGGRSKSCGSGGSSRSESGGGRDATASHPAHCTGPGTATATTTGITIGATKAKVVFASVLRSLLLLLGCAAIAVTRKRMNGIGQGRFNAYENPAAFHPVPLFRTL